MIYKNLDSRASKQDDKAFKDDTILDQDKNEDRTRNKILKITLKEHTEKVGRERKTNEKIC